ncbi:hypothetical protein FNF27_01090 [Cafeteria roenbergensis]|uniref:EF-hand domain-containing protein n=1 Tax=Cafeteria roenbergensis TaxID=33653 RepID=A0A5A8EID0_CAFRO|nr:hypothetical protein FNF27_01090 [Cafeteria roenbergensis]
MAASAALERSLGADALPERDDPGKHTVVADEGVTNCLTMRGFTELLGGLAMRLFGRQAADAVAAQRMQAAAGGVETAARLEGGGAVPEQLELAMRRAVAPGFDTRSDDAAAGTTEHDANVATWARGLDALGGAPSTDELEAVALLRACRPGLLAVFRYFRESGSWSSAALGRSGSGRGGASADFVASRGLRNSGASASMGATRASAASHARRARASIGHLDLALMRRAFTRFDADGDGFLLGPEVDAFIEDVRKASPSLDPRWAARVRRLAADGLSFDEFCSCMLALLRASSLRAQAEEAVASARSLDDGVSEEGFRSLLRQFGVAASDLPRSDVTDVFEAALAAQDAFFSRAGEILSVHQALHGDQPASPSVGGGAVPRDTLGFRFFVGALAAAGMQALSRLPLRDSSRPCTQRTAMILVGMDVSGATERLGLRAGQQLFPAATAVLDSVMERLKREGHSDEVQRGSGTAFIAVTDGLAARLGGAPPQNDSPASAAAPAGSSRPRNRNLAARARKARLSRRGGHSSFGAGPGPTTDSGQDLLRRAASARQAMGLGTRLAHQP